MGTDWRFYIFSERIVLKAAKTQKTKTEITDEKKPLKAAYFFGVTDGARTHDNRNHNPGLYQLSYGHH